MKPHPLALALTLSGCATGPLSYRAEISPLAYRGVKAATGAAATLGLERAGVPQPWATIAGVVGPVVVGKLARPQHHHPLGDWACDLHLSAAVVPLLVAKPRGGKWRLSLGLTSAAAWVAGMAAIDQECSP